MADERTPTGLIRLPRARLMLGVSEWTFNKLVREEGLDVACVKLGKRSRRFDPVKIEEWIKARRAA